MGVFYTGVSPEGFRTQNTLRYYAIIIPMATPCLAARERRRRTGRRTLYGQRGLPRRLSLSLIFGGSGLEDNVWALT